MQQWTNLDKNKQKSRTQLQTYTTIRTEKFKVQFTMSFNSAAKSRIEAPRYIPPTKNPPLI